MKDCYALNGGAVDSGAHLNPNDNPTSLVKAHLGMVDVLAKQLMQQYIGCPWLTESDFAGAGYEALFDAARAYDASRIRWSSTSPALRPRPTSGRSSCPTSAKTMPCNWRVPTTSAAAKSRTSPARCSSTSCSSAALPTSPTSKNSARRSRSPAAATAIADQLDSIAKRQTLV